MTIYDPKKQYVKIVTKILQNYYKPIDFFFKM